MDLLYIDCNFKILPEIQVYMGDISDMFSKENSVLILQLKACAF